jgi:diguanylate cyclase (GGDEF)-like protein/PAS domain S-box-containing protein
VELVTHATCDGRIVAADGDAPALLGVPATALLGRRLEQLCHPEDLPLVRARASVALRRGRPTTLSFRARRIDGAHPSYVWLETRLALEYDGGGDPRLVCRSTPAETGPGIPAADGPAAPTPAPTPAPAQPAPRFHQAFVAAGIAMAITSRRGLIEEVNQALCDLLGRAASDLVGRSVLDVLHPDDAHAVVDAGRRARVEAAQFDARCLREDGGVVHVQITASGLREPDSTDREPTGFVTHVVDVTAHVERARELTHRASHDELTGLPNRGLLLDKLEEALDRARRLGAFVAVLFCDLDEFKAVNDEHGHAAGDALLAEVAGRLRAVVRRGDVVGRLGGDEFVVVATAVEHEEIAALRARIVEALEVPVELGDAAVEVPCSIGVAVADQGSTAAELLHRADQRMYRNKSLARARLWRG